MVLRRQLTAAPTCPPLCRPAAGMDFFVCLERPGYRVARRREQQGRVGVQHRVTKEDAIKWCAPPARRVDAGAPAVWLLQPWRAAR